MRGPDYRLLTLVNALFLGCPCHCRLFRRRYRRRAGFRAASRRQHARIQRGQPPVALVGGARLDRRGGAERGDFSRHTGGRLSRAQFHLRPTRHRHRHRADHRRLSLHPALLRQQRRLDLRVSPDPVRRRHAQRGQRRLSRHPPARQRHAALRRGGDRRRRLRDDPRRRGDERASRLDLRQRGGAGDGADHGLHGGGRHPRGRLDRCDPGDGDGRRGDLRALLTLVRRRRLGGRAQRPDAAGRPGRYSTRGSDVATTTDSGATAGPPMDIRCSVRSAACSATSKRSGRRCSARSSPQWPRTAPTRTWCSGC